MERELALAGVLLAATCLGATSDIREFGASESAAPAANAAAIQRAIDAAGKAGGGRVTVPAGTFSSGTIWLRPRVELHLDEGAVLKASGDLADYNRLDAYPENWGCPGEYWNGCHFIIARQADGASITGPGTIHGNGDAFYEETPKRYFDWMTPASDAWWNGIRWAKDKKNLRPGQLVAFVKSKDVSVRGVTIVNSPCWSLWFWGCERVRVSDYTVRNGENDGNSDGIDFDCSRDVVLERADIAAGDDAIAIRASARAFAPSAQGRLGLPDVTEKVRIRDCRLRSTSSVMRIGVGAGVIRDVVVENVRSDRGGTAVTMATCYGNSRNGGTDFEKIVFRNCHFSNCRRGAHLLANGGDHLKFGFRDIRFEDCSFGGRRPSVGSLPGVRIPLDKREIVFVRVPEANGISLDGAWELSYRFQQEGGEWKTVPARVPGDAYIALQEAGVLPDLTVGTNVFAALRYEQCEWRYRCVFPGVKTMAGERASLRFDGVDTRADYYLNGELIGHSENMFVPVRFDVTGRLKDENVLEVNIKSPLGRPLLGVLGRSRVGGTDVEGIRKAQHSFGWDIMPRVVSGGIWRGVSLDILPECRFGDVHWMCVRADPAARTADVRVDCQILAPWRHLHEATLRITLSRNGKVASRREHVVRFYQTRDSFTVRDADLWWPRDAGEAALYDATVEFLAPDGAVLARDTRKVGLRTIRLEREDWRSEKEPGTFRFVVNGTPIYMHGCDVTPMDALHSRDAAHLPRCLEMLVDLNCNMVRVWGGGVYESDAFYDFCDANGICVWQDFMMGNVEPEQNDAFAATIAAEAREQVVRLRSHPCLALWCANNEIDRSVGWNWGKLAPDPEGERISREVLPRVLRDFDPITPYIPSSPWWTPAVVKGEAKLSQDHLWGPRQKFYKDPFWCNATPTFVSETGYHGCPNIESLRKMMTPEGLHPWPDPGNPFSFNAEWNAKAVTSYPDQQPMGSGRNSLMPHQVKNMFGSVPKDLESFAEQSQIVQAEALKYWLELSRTRKGRTWGMLWWNLRDGWPVISDGVVDYYFGKKKAYGYLKSVQQPQLVACVEEGRLVAVNDRLRPVRGTVRARDCATGRTLYEGEVEIPANGTRLLAERLPLSGKGMVRIDYAFEGVERVNRCLYGVPPFSVADYLSWRER